MGRRTLSVLPWLVAAALLAGLVLVRLYAALSGLLSAPILALLTLILTAAALLAARRFGLCSYVFRAGRPAWKTAAVFVVSFALGGLFDMSHRMISNGGRLIALFPVRLLCAGGSGLVAACLALALYRAAEDFGAVARPSAVTFLMVALVCNLMSALYITGSATVYTWDNAGYWTVAASLAEQPMTLSALRDIAGTVLTHDYNHLLALPISLLMRLFGTGRYVFVCGIVNLYFLPGAWGLFVLGGRRKGLGVLPVLILPMLFYIALLGFVDVAAASLAIWAVVLYTEPERNGAAAGLLTGILLTGTFLLRRYFFFFAVSFGLGALAAALIRRRGGWGKFFALFGSTAISSLLLTQKFLIDKILESSYSVLYSAYQQGRWVDAVMFARYFGLTVLIAAVGLGVFLLLRGGAARENATLALVQMVLCFFLLTRVQSHGSQHLLLYAPALALLLSDGLAALPARRAVSIAAAVLAGVTAVSPLIPRAQPASPAEITILAPLPSFGYQPPRRGDIAQLISLHGFVDSLSADEPKTAAVVASSFVFNGETYTNLYPSLGVDPGDGPSTALVYMTGVDKRDAFSWNVLGADYLIIGDPVQTHLGEENQQVMALLARDVLSGTGLGTAYEALDETFALDGGCTVRIFRRTRTVTEEERQLISARLTALYPDFSELYRYG